MVFLGPYPRLKMNAAPLALNTYVFSRFRQGYGAQGKKTIHLLLIEAPQDFS
jgi:hypothetical protein